MHSNVHSTLLAEKPGKCINRIFIGLACKPHEVAKLCNNDGDCPGTQKCCRTSRCVTQCEEPAGKILQIDLLYKISLTVHS